MGFISRLDDSRQLIEILLKRGTMSCVIDNGVCVENYYFPDAEHIAPDFPESMQTELKEQKHCTGKEKINPGLFPEYDLPGFTWQDWANLRPVIVQRVCERGTMTDLYALVIQYGYGVVRNTIRKDIKSFSDIGGLYLASALFSIPLKEIKAYQDNPELQIMDDAKECTYQSIENNTSKIATYPHAGVTTQA